MFSIYSSAFNVIKNDFEYELFINKFCEFADEVVIAVNKSEDNTLATLQDLESKKNNLKIIATNFSYEDPLLDGKIKNEALQNTSNQIKIGLDLDEYIPTWQKEIWTGVGELLTSNKDIGCIMIPSLNLYKDKDHYTTIGRKWYLHKEGYQRGAVNFARKKNGTVDTSKSDTCELIDTNGNLVPSLAFDNSIGSLRSGSVPFVVHAGYIDLEKRVKRNLNFWHNHWKIESGGEEPNHKVHKDVSEFNESYQEHLLKI
jgi:glycosyltransferase involved in cell wall biosynthesis